MTEKDRYGETLRNREKAEEDRYAAEQDRIRLEKLRQQAQAAQGAKGLCPHCGAVLVSSRKLDVSIQTCGKCRGVWLGMDDLERILARASEGEIVRFVRSLLS
jgi:ribosomal protein L37AE/L43A